MNELPYSIIIFFAVVGFVSIIAGTMATISYFFDWKIKTDSDIRILYGWKEDIELLWTRLRALENDKENKV